MNFVSDSIIETEQEVFLISVAQGVFPVRYDFSGLAPTRQVVFLCVTDDLSRAPIFGLCTILTTPLMLISARPVKETKEVG